MFDNISVADSLPYNDEMRELKLDINNTVFQTKDLDCLMDNYFVQNGKLYIQKYKTEKWMEGDKNAKSYLDRIGWMQREDPYYEEVKYHGVIHFYDFKNNVNDKWDCWIEYKATFTEGALNNIELFKFSKTDNAERLQREKEWIEKIEVENKKFINKYFLHTDPVRKTRNKISRFLYKAGEKITQFSYKV